MRSSRLLVPTAVLGFVAPLAVAAVTSPAAAAGCGVPVWDFNHDGRTDAAAGAYPSGQVYYGDGTGGVDPGEVSLSRIREAVEGDGAESVEALASISLADSVGEEDFCSLLAVGLPNATIDGQENAGAVLIFRVLPGHDEYIGVEPDELLFTITQANDGLDQTVPTANARFGASLAAPDQSSVAEGVTPLAIGAPGETVEGVAGAGSVAVVTLSKTGEVTSARRATRAPGKGLTKSSALGTSLSASRGLVVAGAPGRTVSGKTGAGSVLLIPTDPAVPAKEITQATSGVQGSVEKGDRFGHSVSSWWNPPLDRHEIGIGVPGEDVGKVVDGGQVTTLRSTTAGALSTIKSFTQNTSAVHGSVEKADQFGHAIAVLPRAGKASAWLIGVPYENVGSTVDEGQIQTIGETKNRTWGWKDLYPGEGANRGFRFGEALAPPRGDRGPVWLAENTVDDRFAGVIRPDGSLDGIGYDYEAQYDIGPGIG